MLLGHNHPVSKLKRNQEEESLGVRRLHKKEAGMKAKKDKGGNWLPWDPRIATGPCKFQEGLPCPQGWLQNLTWVPYRAALTVGFLHSQQIPLKNASLSIKVTNIPPYAWAWALIIQLVYLSSYQDRYVLTSFQLIIQSTAYNFCLFEYSVISINFLPIDHPSHQQMTLSPNSPCALIYSLPLIER